MVVGGQRQKTTEVVEFTSSRSTPSYGELPTIRKGAVGAMFVNVPILCGGYSDHDYDYLDSCLSFQNSQWISSHSMTDTRSEAAGVQINSTTLWILGGNSNLTSLDSTEFIIEGQTNGVPGPNLPYELYDMCVVKLSENEIFVIGGVGDSIRNEVWIYDPQNGFARNQGPPINIGRSHHACSTMSDGEKTFIIVAGGNNREHSLDSVEIYDPTEKAWHSGRYIVVRFVPLVIDYNQGYKS